MASHSLTLYMGSCSTYNLDGIPASNDLVPESSFVREEARLITEAPLTIMAPLSYAMSGGLNLKSMARSKTPQGDTKEKKTVPTCPTTGAISLKRKVPKVSGPSILSLVTPLGNTVYHASSSMHIVRPSLSYTMVGVRKPDGGYGKVLMHNLAKELVRNVTP